MFVQSILFVAAVFISFASAKEADDVCLSMSDIKEVSGHFTQFKRYVSHEDTICLSSDKIDETAFKVLEAIIGVKKIDKLRLRQFAIQDDFSFQALKENSWWAYFTRRANRFDLSPRACGDPTVAFIWPHIPGEINICPSFTGASKPYRLAAMLHEVRHFDGYGHVTCSRGVLKGSRGACDESLRTKGSYAISAQVLALLGLSESHLSKIEMVRSRAEALSHFEIRFNRPPQIKMTESLIMADIYGNVFEWIENQIPKNIFSLDFPARVFLSGLEYIIYPIDPNRLASRHMEVMENVSESLGNFAETYNDLPGESRAQLLSVGYGGQGVTGSLLTERFILHSCGGTFGKLDSEKWPESIVSHVEFSPSLNYVGSGYVKGLSGRIYRKECGRNGSLRLAATNVTFDREIGFATHLGGRHYGLDLRGWLFEVVKDGNQFLRGNEITFPQNIGPWITINRRVEPYLFEEFRKENAEEFVL